MTRSVRGHKRHMDHLTYEREQRQNGKAMEEMGKKLVSRKAAEAFEPVCRGTMK